MERTTRIVAGLVVVAVTGSLVAGFLQFQDLRGQVVTLRKELDDARGDEALEARVSLVESVTGDVSERQDQLVTGLESIRSQLRQIVGTETGFMPLGFSSIVHLGRRASSIEQRLNLVEGDVADLESCIRDLETAIETGFPVVGCFFF